VRPSPDDTAPGPAARSFPRLRKLAPLLGLALFAVALWTLHDEAARFNLARFRDYLGQLRAWQIAAAIAASAAAYATMVGYDWFAFRFIGRNLSSARIALTAFIGFAFSLNIGHAAMSGGAVRLRLYARWGVGSGDIGRIIAFNLATSFLGQLLLAGAAFAIPGLPLPAGSPLGLSSLRVVGYAMLALVGAAMFQSIRTGGVVGRGRFRFVLPRSRHLIPAVAISAADWALSASVLFVLLPEGSGIGYWHFLGIAMAGYMLGLISMVPGGLGVFEMVVVHLTAAELPPHTMLSAILVYRTIFNFAPFLLSLLLLAGHEFTSRRADGN
jgi:uncharacterized membrane protein YbhN (UPF0104 family)